MIREKLRIKVFQLNEVTLERMDEFPYTEEDRYEVETAIVRKLNNDAIISEDGRVFVVSVANINSDD